MTLWLQFNVFFLLFAFIYVCSLRPRKQLDRSARNFKKSLSKYFRILLKFYLKTKLTFNAFYNISWLHKESFIKYFDILAYYASRNTLPPIILKILEEKTYFVYTLRLGN